MIGNISRAAFFQRCRRYTYNLFVLGQEPLMPAEALTMGGAFHKGVAVLTATRDAKLAKAAVVAEYHERIKSAVLLPEERELVNRNIRIVQAQLQREIEQYEKDDWVLLQPEVEFCVPIPHTEHHCIFVHELLYPSEPWRMGKCDDPRCIINHHLKGRADHLISWKNLLWIIERKTSAVDFQNWWDGWLLNVQPTAYLYGIWKATGQRPNGFIMEKVMKPRKNAKFPEAIDPVQREPYLRSEADLLEFETEIGQIFTDYESAYVNNTWYKNTKACFDWNRKCYYHAQCLRNHEIIPGEFRQRETDYVELEYYKLLGLPVPPVNPTEELHEVDHG